MNKEIEKLKKEWTELYDNELLLQLHSTDKMAREIPDWWASKIEGLLQQERERIAIDEFRKGYNQCLKDEGKVGERWQHKYL